MEDKFSEYYGELKASADEKLMSFIPEEKGLQKTLIEAMNYSLLSGGKRLRPILMLEAWKIFGGNDEGLIAPFMAAIEMIHTFSLVHDDLPAMDNDYYRRGRKTTHAVYGAGMATLAGDALLNFAFETALRASGRGHDDAVIEALKVLALKAGIYGMAGGQCADIESENAEDISDDVIDFVNEHKTACMIESSLMIGGILSGADGESVKKLEEAGSCLGIAFQIRDDVLNKTGTEKEMGKPVGNDAEKGKTNYVAVHGIEEAQRKVIDLSSKAVSIFDGLYRENGIEYAFLSELTRRMTDRKK
ncbi:MAG: polyprenyl synthetase family protein [Synergistaceae bacterium]|nr:polyprenyl synthetase family protein [Synergistaceae bacterium]